MIFLDPHTTQPVGFVQSKEQEHEKKVDCTYHCKHASRLPILHMDPSVAVVSDTLSLYQELLHNLTSSFRLDEASRVEMGIGVQFLLDFFLDF